MAGCAAVGQTAAPTVAECQGLIDRQRLYALSGRSRQGMIELAGQFDSHDSRRVVGLRCLTDPPRARDLLEWRRRLRGGTSNC